MPPDARPAGGQRLLGSLVQEGRQDAHLQLRLQVNSQEQLTAMTILHDFVKF